MSDIETQLYEDTKARLVELLEHGLLKDLDPYQGESSADAFIRLTGEKVAIAALMYASTKTRFPDAYGLELMVFGAWLGRRKLLEEQKSEATNAKAAASEGE